MSHTPSVSLVIVSRNRPAGLRRVLSSIRFQTYTHFEVIVVADAQDAGFLLDIPFSDAGACIRHVPPPSLPSTSSATPDEAKSDGKADTTKHAGPYRDPVGHVPAPRFPADALLKIIPKYNEKPHMDDVRALIDGGIDLQFQDESGSTALMHASSRGHTDVVKALLNTDSAVELIRHQNKHLSTSLSWASFEGDENLAVVKLLLEADPSEEHIRMVDDGGDTSLIGALINGSTEIAKTLLEADPSPEHVRVVNGDGRTAFQIAHDRRGQPGVQEIVTLLRTAETGELASLRAAEAAEKRSKHDKLAEKLRASFDDRMKTAMTNLDQRELNTLCETAGKMRDKSEAGSANYEKWTEWLEHCRDMEAAITSVHYPQACDDQEAAIMPQPSDGEGGGSRGTRRSRCQRRKRRLLLSLTSLTTTRRQLSSSVVRRSPALSTWSLTRC